MYKIQYHFQPKNKYSEDNAIYLKNRFSRIYSSLFRVCLLCLNNPDWFVSIKNLGVLKHT